MSKPIGAHISDDGSCTFSVWAPDADSVALHLHKKNNTTHSMVRDSDGYWHLTLETLDEGTRYTYLLNGETDRPDPASHSQPDGVHEPSAVVNHTAFQWEDEEWESVPLEEIVLYELHIGTFTEQGTFESAIHRLDHLADLGVNMVDVMPVAQFPGGRNWGYDGVYPFAAQSTYGGPKGFKRFINACHKQGIGVTLDVVYNHLGPEGNYLWDYGPYFTKKYRTPWGEAVNFDGPHSDHVRNYFIQNAIHWFREFHIDALRLDAVHAIFDNSAKPFLRELAEKVEQFSEEQGRQYYLMPESNLNDTRIIRPWETGGFGHHTQWLDDFHHALHTILTGENDGYYVDFGEMDDLVKCLKEGFVYDWRYSSFRKRRHGNSSVNRPAREFVAFTQNHDQIGNRMNGERLSQLVPFEATKLAAASLMLAPYIPMLFMGEEHAEQAPFLYFVSHNDEQLIEAVREGRRKEFESFEWVGNPPDPQSEETFRRSKLNWHLREENGHSTILQWYKELIALRKSNPAMQHLSKENLTVETVGEQRGLVLHRWKDTSGIFAILNFQEGVFSSEIEFPEGQWERLLDSSDDRWQGQGSEAPESVSRTITLEIPSFGAIIYQRTT